MAKTKKTISKETAFLNKLYELNKDVIIQQEKNSSNINLPKDQRVYRITLTNAVPFQANNRFSINKKFYITSIIAIAYVETSMSSKSVTIYDNGIGGSSLVGSIFNFEISGAGIYTIPINFSDPIVMTSAQYSGVVGTPIGANDRISINLIGYER